MLGFGAFEAVRKIEGNLIATLSELDELVTRLAGFDRVAVDTEADSLHCYREKLCLLQLSVPEGDFLVDPLKDVDLSPLRDLLSQKEIVLHGSDFDLRILRRGMQLVATRVFDTVIAARLLGITEFSLAALIQRFFGVALPKGSQKANWAQRPLSARMKEYAINDTHYLLPLAKELEAHLGERGRLDWFRQSCARAIEQAANDRVRDSDEVWRISGAGALEGAAAAVLRELWQWREDEAQIADRPAFHILRNEEMLRSAKAMVAGDSIDFRHFSDRRRRGFREAAERGLAVNQQEWPQMRRRKGVRRSAETERAIERLRKHRDSAAANLELEPAFIAPRAALEAIAANPAIANEVLVSWQRELLHVNGI